MKVKLLGLLLLSAVTACTTNSNKVEDKIVTCKEPRLQMCTMDYRPVFGRISPSQVKTYSNGCVACSDTQVLSYTEQACPEEDLKNNSNKSEANKADSDAIKLSSVSYRAVGQEPGWLLEIIHGKYFYISSNYGELVKTYPYVEPTIDFEKGTKIYQVDKGIVIKLTDKTCTDSMSGDVYSTSVSMKFNSRHLKGCAKVVL